MGTVGTRRGVQEAQPAESSSAKEASRAEPVAATGVAPQPFPTTTQAATAERREAEPKPAARRDIAPEPPAAAMDLPAPAGESVADVARAPVVGEEGPRAAAPAPLMRSRVAPEAGASAVRPAPKKSALIREYENQTPEKWLEKIAELRRDGRTTEADEMLAEFKKRFPGYPLPAALR